MSVKSPGQISLDLGASRALFAVLLAVHGGAVVIALGLPIPLLLRVVLAALVGVSCYDAAMRHALRRARRAIVALRLNADEDLCAVRRAGAERWEEGKLIDRWVHPWLTLLVVRCEGRRWPVSVVIPADAVAQEPFRRLRVQLRLPTAGA